MAASTFHVFRFDGLRAVFAPRRPRHPLLRVLLGALGLVLLAGLVVVGLVVGSVMLLGGLAWRALRKPRTRAADDGVIEGDFREVTPDARAVIAERLPPAR
jgi:predicted anti-sigma-YlaC factor YlaD